MPCTHNCKNLPFFTFIEGIKDDSYSKGKITINHDVWIGDQVSILSGVTIGNGAVIAARTVVTKDVPSYAIVAGNPGEVKKYRFDVSTCDALYKIGWWYWSDEKIKENIEYFYGDVKDFVERFA